jgi:hypothetical protein
MVGQVVHMSHPIQLEKYLSVKELHIRVIRNVRKTQHQNPEFGHTQGEIKTKPEIKYISIQGGMKLRKPSILLVN